MLINAANKGMYNMSVWGMSILLESRVSNF